MIDLLPLVLEGGPPQTDANGTPSPQPRRQTESQDSSAGGKARGRGGLLGKLAGRSLRSRKSSDGDAAVGSGQAEPEPSFSPLGRGQNGAAALQHQDSDPLPEPPEPTGFMGRLRRMHARSRSSQGSLGSRGSEPEAPLADGAARLSLGGPRTLKNPTEPPVQDEGLREFFASVSEAKALLAEVVKRQRQIEAERSRLRSLASPADIRAAQEQVRQEVEAVTLLCRRVKAALLRLDALNAALLAGGGEDGEGEEGQEPSSDDAAARMRLSVMAGLNARLADVTKRWQEGQAAWLDQDREEVARQLHTVTGRVVEPEAVEQLLAAGGAEGLYRQALAGSHGDAAAQLASDVQQRHDQVRALEAAMTELHQVFLDMSILVSDQGDMIDRIDGWVSSTGSAMQDSLRSLRAAARDRRRAARAKAITFVTGVGLVAGGAGLTATGVGAVAGVPMIVAGAAAVGGSALGGLT